MLFRFQVQNVIKKLNNLKICANNIETINRLPVKRCVYSKPIRFNRFPGEISSAKAFLELRRFKFTKKSKSKEESDSEDEDDDDDDEHSKAKLIISHMTSLRADSVLKAGLGIARNKIDVLFYESRIRVNGHKIPKKSYRLNVKDEVDLIKSASPINNQLLTVSRIIVVGVKENDDGDGLVVKLRRYKSLNVENYEGADAWKNGNK